MSLVKLYTRVTTILLKKPTKTSRLANIHIIFEQKKSKWEKYKKRMVPLFAAPL